jgi:hypothetical protein
MKLAGFEGGLRGLDGLGGSSGWRSGITRGAAS